MPFVTLYAAHPALCSLDRCHLLIQVVIQWCLSILSQAQWRDPFAPSKICSHPVMASDVQRRKAVRMRKIFSSSHGAQCSDKYAVTKKF